MAYGTTQAVRRVAWKAHMAPHRVVAPPRAMALAAALVLMATRSVRQRASVVLAMAAQRSRRMLAVLAHALGGRGATTDDGRAGWASQPDAAADDDDMIMARSNI